MKNLKVNKTMILLVTALQMFSCRGNVNKENVNLEKTKTNIQDTIKSKVLVITSVISPWYAWRGLIINKMKKSIPQYQSIPGLNQKLFCLTENKALIGGIYFWNTKQDAEKWFNKEWFDRTEKKYGEKGNVHYYQIMKTVIYEDIDKNETSLWSVLSYNEKQLLFDNKTEGLINTIFLTDDNNKSCTITLWKNKEVAKKYFKDKESQNGFFDTPIFVQN